MRSTKLPDGVVIKRTLRPAGPKKGPVVLTNDERRVAFKGDCCHCHAPMIVMSEMANHLPTTHVGKGDVIKCDACTRHVVVEAVNPGNRLQLCKLPIPKLL